MTFKGEWNDIVSQEALHKHWEWYMQAYQNTTPGKQDFKLWLKQIIQL